MEVSENNPKYSTMNKVLFNKEKIVLISYPQTKSGLYRISDGVEKIEEGAFSGRTKLISAVFPKPVVEIGMSAFENCPNLESVELPDKLDTIGNWAFSNCPKLLSINIGQIRSFGEGVFENTPICFPHESKTIGDIEQLMELALIYL